MRGGVSLLLACLLANSECFVFGRRIFNIITTSRLAESYEELPVKVIVLDYFESRSEHPGQRGLG